MITLRSSLTSLVDLNRLPRLLGLMLFYKSLSRSNWCWWQRRITGGSEWPSSTSLELLVSCLARIYTKPNLVASSWVICTIPQLQLGRWVSRKLRSWPKLSKKTGLSENSFLKSFNLIALTRKDTTIESLAYTHSEPSSSTLTRINTTNLSYQSSKRQPKTTFQTSGSAFVESLKSTEQRLTTMSIKTPCAQSWRNCWMTLIRMFKTLQKPHLLDREQYNHNPNNSICWYTDYIIIIKIICWNTIKYYNNYLIQ